MIGLIFILQNAAGAEVHEVGPYGVKKPEQINDIAHYPFSLIVIGYSGPTSPYAPFLSAHHIRCLDNTLWGIVAEAFHARCPEKNTGCSLTNADEEAILSKVDKHLQAIGNDPNVAGFWFLDDDPGGQVISVMEKIRRRVGDQNQFYRIVRPTVCGLGERLDYKKSPSDAQFTKSHSYFRRALENYSPAACDRVALYLYGENTYPDPAGIDWSMSDLLPYMLTVLKKRGWNPARDPLVGVVDAFSFPWKAGEPNFVEPRHDDIVTQTEAYCKWGASSILFYAWDDSVSDPRKHEGYNSPQLVQAVVDGVQSCRNNDWQK